MSAPEATSNPNAFVDFKFGTVDVSAQFQKGAMQALGVITLIGMYALYSDGSLSGAQAALVSLPAVAIFAGSYAEHKEFTYGAALGSLTVLTLVLLNESGIPVNLNLGYHMISGLSH